MPQCQPLPPDASSVSASRIAPVILTRRRIPPHDCRGSASRSRGVPQGVSRLRDVTCVRSGFETGIGSHVHAGVPADSCRKNSTSMIEPENLHFPSDCSPQGRRSRAPEDVRTRNPFPSRRRGHQSVPPCPTFSTRIQVILRTSPTPGQGGVRGFEMMGTANIVRFLRIGTGKDRSSSCKAVGIEVAPRAVRPIIGSVRRMV